MKRAGSIPTGRVTGPVRSAPIERVDRRTQGRASAPRARLESRRPTYAASHTMTRQELADAVYRAAYITGAFTLRSGVVSNEYFDKYAFESDPLLLRDIAHALTPLIPTGSEALAGLELGGVPIATMLAHAAGLPTRFVRKAAKTYGTARLAEGGPIDGRRLLLVEDVVTSGGQVIASAKDLRALGAIVTDALCVIDRESGGASALAAEGITLHALFTMSELKRSAV